MLGGDRWRDRRKPAKAKPEPEQFLSEIPEDIEDEEEPYWLSRWCDVFELALAHLLEAHQDKLSSGAAISDTTTLLDNNLVERAREIANYSILQMKFQYAEFAKEEQEEEEQRRKAEEEEEEAGENDDD